MSRDRAAITSSARHGRAPLRHLVRDVLQLLWGAPSFRSARPDSVEACRGRRTRSTGSGASRPAQPGCVEASRSTARATDSISVVQVGTTSRLRRGGILWERTRFGTKRRPAQHGQAPLRLLDAPVVDAVLERRPGIHAGLRLGEVPPLRAGPLTPSFRPSRSARSGSVEVCSPRPRSRPARWAVAVQAQAPLRRPSSRGVVLLAEPRHGCRIV